MLDTDHFAKEASFLWARSTLRHAHSVMRRGTKKRARLTEMRSALHAIEHLPADAGDYEMPLAMRQEMGALSLALSALIARAEARAPA